MVYSLVGWEKGGRGWEEERQWRAYANSADVKDTSFYDHYDV